MPDYEKFNLSSAHERALRKWLQVSGEEVGEYDTIPEHLLEANKYSSAESLEEKAFIREAAVRNLLQSNGKDINLSEHIPEYSPIPDELYQRYKHLSLEQLRAEARLRKIEADNRRNTQTCGCIMSSLAAGGIILLIYLLGRLSTWAGLV